MDMVQGVWLVVHGYGTRGMVGCAWIWYKGYGRVDMVQGVWLVVHGYGTRGMVVWIWLVVYGYGARSNYGCDMWISYKEYSYGFLL